MNEFRLKMIRTLSSVFRQRSISYFLAFIVFFWGLFFGGRSASLASDERSVCFDYGFSAKEVGMDAQGNLILEIEDDFYLARCADSHDIPQGVLSEAVWDEDRPYVLQLVNDGKVIRSSRPYGRMEFESTCVDPSGYFVPCDLDESPFPQYLEHQWMTLQEPPDQICLLYKGEEVFQKTRTPHSPEIKFVEESVDEDRISLKWQGTDQDGDQIWYTVYLKEDESRGYVGRRVWPHWSGDEEKEAMLSTSYDYVFDQEVNSVLLKTTRFWVMATDGMNVSWILSKEFTLPQREQEYRVDINFPENGVVINDRDSDGFQHSVTSILPYGLSFLIKMRQKDEYAGPREIWEHYMGKVVLEIISDIDGVIGREEFFGGLPIGNIELTNFKNPGDHNLTFKVKNEEGQGAQATIKVTIKSLPSNTPASAGGIF